MWSLDTLKAINADQRRQRAHLTPIETLDDIDADTLRIVHAPAKWLDVEPLDTLFVDSTGADSTGPALSQKAFLHRLRALFEEHGPLKVGITERGQFQVYVGVWRKDAKAA